MANSRVRWAVLGMGLQGERLKKAIEASSSARLVMVGSERQKGSFTDILRSKDVDAVAIATPNDRHAEQVVSAALAGKHILCEKPLALSSAECNAMRKVIRKHRVRCYVNYHLRMHPEVQKARSAIRAGSLGELTFIEMQWSIGGLAKKAPPLPRHMAWREDPKRAGGGALMARGVHLFDLLRFLTGGEISLVRAWSDARKDRVDRTAIGILNVNGVPALMTTSKATLEADNHIAIYGTSGTIVLRDVFTADPHKLYVKVCNAFAEELRGKKTALATFEDGVAAVKITETFMRSASGVRDTIR